MEQEIDEWIRYGLELRGKNKVKKWIDNLVCQLIQIKGYKRNFGFNQD